jgi:multidrug efflux pump subunit AcrB
MLATPSYTLTTSVEKMIMDDTADAAGPPGGGSSGAKHASHTGTSGAVEAAPMSSPAPSVSLSPDAVMAYCESRMDSLDTQMNQIMGQQQSNQTATSALDTLANAINSVPGPDSKTPPKVTMSQQQFNTITAAYQAALSDCPQLESTIYGDATTFSKGISWNKSQTEYTISSDTLNGLEQNVKNDASNMNSNSEMIMINLQSLMSQRQTAVQLTTNLVQSLGDQSSSIAKNMGQ